MAHTMNKTGGASFVGEKCRSSGDSQHLPRDVDIASAAAATPTSKNDDHQFAVPSHPAPRSRPSIMRRSAQQQKLKKQHISSVIPPPSSMSKQTYLEKMKTNEKVVDLEELNRRNQMLENLLAALRASGDGHAASAMHHKLIEVPGCSLDMRTGRLRVLGDLVELADGRQHQTSSESVVSAKKSAAGARLPPVPVIDGK